MKPAVAAKTEPQGAVLIFSSAGRIIATGQLNGSGLMTWLVPADLANTSMYAVYVGNATFATSQSPTVNEETMLAKLH